MGVVEGKVEDAPILEQTPGGPARLGVRAGPEEPREGAGGLIAGSCPGGDPSRLDGPQAFGLELTPAEIDGRLEFVRSFSSADRHRQEQVQIIVKALP